MVRRTNVTLVVCMWITLGIATGASAQTERFVLLRSPSNLYLSALAGDAVGLSQNGSVTETWLGKQGIGTLTDLRTVEGTYLTELPGGLVRHVARGPFGTEHRISVNSAAGGPTVTIILSGGKFLGEANGQLYSASSDKEPGAQWTVVTATPSPSIQWKPGRTAIALGTTTYFKLRNDVGKPLMENGPNEVPRLDFASLWTLRSVKSTGIASFGSGYILATAGHAGFFWVVPSGANPVTSNSGYETAEQWVLNSVSGSDKPGSRLYYGAKVAISNPATGKYLCGKIDSQTLTMCDTWGPWAWWTLEAVPVE